jgi:phage gp46-like protein
MSDIKLSWDIDVFEAIAKFLQSTNDVETDDGLSTMVIVSLFTDARADVDDPLPDENGGRRGWWADETSDKAGDSVGSKLWLYERSKLDDRVLLDIQKAGQDALKWMTDEGVAKNVKVEATMYALQSGKYTVLLTVEITKPDGKKLPYKFEGLWEGTL